MGKLNPSAKSGWADFLSLLKTKNFLSLWLGQLFSQGGDRLTQLMLVALAAKQSAGSTFSLAQILVATALPALLLNPFAGVYVDRWSRKTTMVICDIIRVGIILTFPWLASFPSSVPLYTAVFLLFAVSAFFVPARLAIIPDLVPRDRLAKANALFTTSGMAGSAVVILVGALLIEWFGITKAAWVNAFFFGFSAICILSIKIGKESHHLDPTETTGRILHEIVEGLGAMWRHLPTRKVIVLIGLLMAGAGATIVVGTVMIQETLGSVTKDIGFLSLWFGVGVFLGTLAYGRWESGLNRRLTLGASFLGTGLALAGIIAAVLMTRSAVLASCGTLMLGAFVAPVGIVANTLIHEGHPERLHGRIFSSFGIVVNISTITSMLLAGWLVDSQGRGQLLAGIALLFCLAGLIIIIRSIGGESPKREQAS